MRQFLHRRDLSVDAFYISFSLMELGVPLDASLLDGLEGVPFRGGPIFAAFDALVDVGKFPYSELARELVGADLRVFLGDGLLLQLRINWWEGSAGRPRREEGAAGHRLVTPPRPVY